MNSYKPIKVQRSAGIEETPIDQVYSGVRALSERIVQSTAKSCSQHFGSSLRAVILTGSLARDEGSMLDGRVSGELASDAEFILVLHDHAPLPKFLDIACLTSKIESQLSAVGAQCHLSLTCTHDDFLRKMRPHIFAYETKISGRVVIGETNILSLIPEFTPADIPREDAWRLLSNRMVEMIEVLPESATDAPNAQVCYRAAKLYLDIATSLLLFVGEYAPSYRQRCENLRELAASAKLTGPLPFPLSPFFQAVESCTTWKLSANSALGGSRSWESVFTACQYAFQLWMWELRKMTGAEEALSAAELGRRAMKQQPMVARIRGWLYVARRRGWAKSWKSWPRWVRLCWFASPRYYIYCVAAQVLVRLPALLRDERSNSDSEIDWQRLRKLLPEAGPRTNVIPQLWDQLATDVVWNYQQFLVETRA